MQTILLKSSKLPPFSDDLFFCTTDAVGPYPNNLHYNFLAAIKIMFDNRTDKAVSIESLMDLAKCALKNVFKHHQRYFKWKRTTTLGTKLTLSYAIIVMSELEKKLLERYSLNPLVWRR